MEKHEVHEALTRIGFNPSIMTFAEVDQKIIDEFPWTGIKLIGGMDHLSKSAFLAYQLYRQDKIYGYIDRMDSWGDMDKFHSLDLLIINNIAKGLFFENRLISTIQYAMSLKIPLLLTSAAPINELEKEVSMTLLSVIETYLTGQL